LRSQIQIQERVTTQADDGEERSAWVTIDGGTVWANIITPGGGETLGQQQINADVTHTIRIRRHALTITPRHRVLFGTRIFDINSVTDPAQRNEMLILQCKEQV
jgi:SPP1 family predicted phage head-tail adaptor